MYIDIKNLNAYYGAVHALQDINIGIEKNKVTALIGPSGCGKSTFLRTINRVHELIEGTRVEGTLLVNGHDIYAKEVDAVSIRRRIGMVFQKANPFPTMSIYQNVASGLILNSFVKKKHLDEVVERSLEQANLLNEVKDRLHKNASELSGGQQQRLCIARTIAVQPEIILMDEPTSALDPFSTMKIEELIIELKKNFTIIIVTHNMQQAARISDSVAFFLSGSLVEYGSTEQIFTSPVNKKTEDYITGRFG